MSEVPIFENGRIGSEFDPEDLEVIKETCDWEPDESYTAPWDTPDTFNGDCGICWSITDYDGQDFKTIDMNFCPKCGKPIKQLPRKPQEDEDE